ncbi:TetR/AcrR family transcriptional regulator [Sphingobacterium multivorum]|uniref:TetR/AcrR family transcriptional regulator n=1 Tax=Sphingobacterium multivorum TaxID=28454 RepID=UPI00301AEB79
MGRKKNFNEEDILDRSIVLFQRLGYHATSPEELVNHLKISRSSLYATFGDKRGLLIKALHRYSKLTSDALEQIKRSAKNPKEAISKIFDLVVKGCYQPGMPNGCFLVNSIIEFGPHDEQALQIIQQSYNNSRDTILHFLEMLKCSSPSHSDLDIETVTDFLVNTISGMVVSTKAGMDEEACHKMIEHTLSILK